VLVSFGYRNWWNSGGHGKTALRLTVLEVISGKGYAQKHDSRAEGKK